MTRPDTQDLPSEAERTEAYNEELVRRYLTGQFLTAADKREAKMLIVAGVKATQKRGDRK